LTEQHIVLSEDTVNRALDELAHLRGRVATLEKALRDVRNLAGDRERFVMLGPRAFVAAVRIVDAVLGSADPGKPAVQP
jgi:prefoldin subunit 5